VFMNTREQKATASTREKQREKLWRKGNRDLVALATHSRNVVV